MGFANQELVRLVRVFFAFGDRQDKKFSDIGQDYGEEGVLKRITDCGTDGNGV